MEYVRCHHLMHACCMKKLTAHSRAGSNATSYYVLLSPECLIAVARGRTYGGRRGRICTSIFPCMSYQIEPRAGLLLLLQSGTGRWFNRCVRSLRRRPRVSPACMQCMQPAAWRAGTLVGSARAATKTTRTHGAKSCPAPLPTAVRAPVPYQIQMPPCMDM